MFLIFSTQELTKEENGAYVYVASYFDGKMDLEGDGGDLF
jgi:hypothetical protein